MSKKLNSVFMVMIIIVLSAFMLAESADAFCVYNWTDKQIRVVQTGGTAAPIHGESFDIKIDPKGKECCNWEQKVCNDGGKRDSIVEFAVSWSAGLLDSRYICYNFPVKAGGWLSVSGSQGNYKCEAKY